MTPQRFRQIRLFFESVIDLTPGDRAHILVETRKQDPELAREVEELVAAYQRRSGFIEQPAISVRVLEPLEEWNPDLAGTSIGPYQLAARVGEGGMGEVWCAEQTAPVRRRVAVKLIKAGMDTREVVARFESERQALALMDHPAIAKVFDAGSTAAGRPYFAMEYVSGIPITTYCDRHRLTTRERLKLFIRVCEGIQHAHQKAIIHRDVKPSNILVTEVDGKPAPKIIDFGVARAISGRRNQASALTRVGAILGTPDYMSPEQAYSTGDDIDTRTDVYSLGVVLYELLAGALPFDFRNLGLEEVLRTLREADAPRPSAKAQGLEEPAGASHNRRTEIGTLTRQLRGDLDAITLKALEKDRSRRYGSPAELAADISRYLRNEPVLARPISVSYQAGKYIRRHFAVVGAVFALVMLLASFGAVEAVQLQRLTRERDRSNRIANFMTGMFKVSDPSESRGNQIKVREILDRASSDIGKGLAKDPDMQAQMMGVMGQVYRNLGLFPQSEALLEKVLEIRRASSGAGSALTATAMNDLAGTLDDEGRRAEAEKLYRDAYAIRLRRLGPKDPATLQSMNNLAVVLREAGRYRESETLIRQVLELRREVLGPRDPATLTSLDNLASALDHEGKFREAEAVEREVLNTKRQVLGPDHPETLHAIHHLADTLYGEGEYAESERLHREELSETLRVLGPENPNTLGAMLGLANVLDDQGRHAEAARLDRQAIAVQRRVLGAEHPETLLAMGNLSGVLCAEGEYEEAEQLVREVIAGRTRTLGAEHSDTLFSRSGLGWILLMRGRLGEAEKELHDVLRLQSRVLGPQHPDTADTECSLASLAARQGRTAEGLVLLRKAVDDGMRPAERKGLDKDPRWQPFYGDPAFRAVVAYAREKDAHQQQ